MQPSTFHDSTDRVVNGAADALDLAPVQLTAASGVPDDATASLSVTGKANLFLQEAGQWRPVTDAARLTAQQLRTGASLGVEATAIRSKVWNGEIAVTITATSATGTSADTVRLQVAPLLTHHHLQAPEKVLVSVSRLPVTNTLRAMTP